MSFPPIQLNFVELSFIQILNQIKSVSYLYEVGCFFYF